MDKEFGGEAWAAEGVRSATWRRSRISTRTRRWARTSCSPSRDMKEYLDRFNEISMKFAEQMTTTR